MTISHRLLYAGQDCVTSLSELVFCNPRECDSGALVAYLVVLTLKVVQICKDGGDLKI